MTYLDQCLDASSLITRAHGARGDAWEALRAMRRRPNSFKALRQYVAASAMVEETELALLKLKRDIENERLAKNA